MILILLTLLTIASVPAAGGRLGRLAGVELRWLWLAPLALVTQVVIVTIAPGGDRALHDVAHVATYLLAGTFLWANRRLPGAVLIAAGTASNAIAIVANGGVMPQSALADRLAGLSERGGFHNAGIVAHPALRWLGDVIPVPGPPHLANVLSVGDLLIFAGAVVLLHRACESRFGAQLRAAAFAGAGRAGVTAAGALVLALACGATIIPGG